MLTNKTRIHASLPLRHMTLIYMYHLGGSKDILRRFIIVESFNYYI